MISKQGNEIFDLDKALKGKPVKLNNGYKAYVLKYLQHSTDKDRSLIGYAEHIDEDTGRVSQYPLIWNGEGLTAPSSSIQEFDDLSIEEREELEETDIIGMWEEEPDDVIRCNLPF